MLRASFMFFLIFASMLSAAEAKVDDTRIVGKWHCTAEGWPSQNYTFKANKTWTDGDETGTYTYDDYTKDLSLSDHAGETLSTFEGGLMWMAPGAFYWPSSQSGDWNCGKKK